MHLTTTHLALTSILFVFSILLVYYITRQTDTSASTAETQWNSTSQKDVNEIYRLLGITQRVLNEQGVEYFIIAGTLLGAVRHKGMIPWDDDIDLTTLDLNGIRNSRATFEKNGLRLLEIDHNTKPYFKVYAPENKRDGDVTFPFIDIFIGRSEGQTIVPYAGGGRMTKKVVTIPKKELYPIQSLQFGPFKLPAPADPNSYLSRVYGDDWDIYGVHTHSHGGPSDVKLNTKIDLRKTNVPPALPSLGQGNGTMIFYQQ